MNRIDIADIERQARQMRADEMRRLSGIMAERTGLYFRLLGRTLTSLAKLLNETLRPLFSWNPQRLHHR
ncbi:MAG: hypothetical protein WCV99_02635 [Sterolibacterium sp.]